MSRELELIRAFRAEDAAVDDETRDAARAALVAHIAAGPSEVDARRGGRLPQHLFGGRIRADIVALMIAVLVVIAVGAVALSVGSRRPQPPAKHVVPRHHAMPVIRNYEPGRLPTLPGQIVCNGDLARPGAIPGLGGSPSGTFQAAAAVVNGVNELPFSIAATGLHANTHGNVYEVWILPAVSTTTNGYALVKPVRARLLGVITPGVGRDGRLAGEGLAPADLNGAYLLQIRLQPHPSATRNGQTVLQGYVVIAT